MISHFAYYINKWIYIVTKSWKIYSPKPKMVTKHHFFKYFLDLKELFKITFYALFGSGLKKLRSIWKSYFGVIFQFVEMFVFLFLWGVTPKTLTKRGYKRNPDTIAIPHSKGAEISNLNNFNIRTLFYSNSVIV